MKKFLKNVSYSFVSNVISMIVGVIATLIFPKFIGVEEFGYYQLYLFYVSYVTISALGLPDGVYLKLGGKKYSEIDKNRIGSIFYLLMIFQVLLYVILFLISSFAKNINEKLVLEVSCCCAIIIISRYFLYLVLQSTNRIREYAWIIITERLFSVVSGLFIVLLGYRGYFWLIMLDAIGRSISLLLACYYCKDMLCIKPRLYKGIFNDSLLFIKSGSMVLFSTLSSTLVIGIVRYAVQNQWDIATFSKISLTVSISNMAVRCINSVGIVMFPTLRNTDENKLPNLYQIINTSLMTLIFFGLIFYQPMAFILKMWLPNYADSVKYAAILLPVCAYECKNAMLISTYLKALLKEKLLLLINIVAIVVSFVGTIISVYLLHSLELAVLIILVSLATRCILGEKYISKLLNINLSKNTILEGTMVIVFILCNWYFGMFGIIIYIICYIFYLALNKNVLINISYFLKTHIK